MKQIADTLEVVLEDIYPKLLSLPEEELGAKDHPEKWSKKEIIGHMVDSAHSNIRRFVVAQYDDEPLIMYQQDLWVKINDYQEYKTADLIQLWYLLNRQIVNILKHMPDDVAERKCLTPDPNSLRWLAEDYIKHLKHHLHVVLNFEPVVYP